MKAINLKTEFLKNPIGVDMQNPRLMWNCLGGIRQKAYRILALCGGKTVCGAIEFIISYVRETWECPVVFYTNSHYESETYASMVAALKEIRQVYGIGVIDLYTDEAFNDVSEDAYRLYMADNIHPTRAGYLLWWTPKIEEELYALVGRN